jgi:ribonuclease D
MAGGRTHVSVITTLGLGFETCTSPARFRELSAQLAREPVIWIDVEVADWFTKNPRLSLVQVRTREGRLHVIDILAPGMAEVLHDAFIPGVMASPSVQKWAHCARYERRFLGQDRVQALFCTFELAKSVPYHRLPLPSLALASLARHLLGEHVDKSPQASDWGLRPLSEKQLAYAAADPEWCFRIQSRLEQLLVHIDPSIEDPAAIQDRMLALLPPLAMANAEGKSVRAAVQAFMTEAGQVRLGGFTLHQRLARTTTLAELIRLALRVDPGRHFDLTMAVSVKLRTAIGPERTEQLRPRCTVVTARSFRGPRLRGPRPVADPYGPVDPARVDADFASIDHRIRLLDSEKDELRDRMKCWLAWKGLDAWGDFVFTPESERWSADVRELAELLPAEPYEMGLPKRYLLAFPPETLEELSPRTKATPVLRWRHPRDLHTNDVQLSRDWATGHDSEGGGAAE